MMGLYLYQAIALLAYWAKPQEVKEVESIPRPLQWSQ
jgi:hypothetical protein